MADEPKRGRVKPVPERFEVFESDPTAHLTEEQKTWKAKLRPVTERFAALTLQTMLLLKLHLVKPLPDADQLALAADIYGLVQTLSETERDLGGSGLTLTNQEAVADTVILTLRHAMSEGASDRAAKLAELLRRAAAQTTFEPKADVVQLLDAATGSAESRVKLLIAGSRSVSRCEVLTAAA